MPFPESKRVIYSKNPLEQVICQLRFPRLLKITASPPVEFQEKIRKDYPILRERPEVQVTLPSEFMQQLPPGAANSIALSNQAYDFVSKDEQWVISLTTDFVALTASKYERWEQFRAQLQMALDALVTEYEPSFFSRIGLRYRNAIRKSDLGLTEEKWSDLLKPYIAGELASPEEEITEAIQGTLHNVLLDLSDQSGQVRIIHGLVHDDDKNENIYLIDNDFFTETETEADDVLTILNRFNRKNGNLFRWCITDKLHEAMEPAPV